MTKTQLVGLLGSVVVKQVTYDQQGNLVIRRYPYLLEVPPVRSASYLIDGAPAAGFTRRLVALIESGYGLECAPLTDEWRPG